MWIRVRGLLRDAFFLPPLVLLGCLLLGVLISWVVAVVVAVAVSGIFVYFALMRYDENGRERKTGV